MFEKSKIKYIWILAAALWLAALAKPLGPVPALGPLFDIRSGVWNHRDFKWKNETIPGLHERVSVAVDANGIPHIFAASEEDLYLAQGYVMASQRLFQMDLSTRTTAGRLSELVGDKGLEMDRFFVKFGMRQSALKTVNEYLADPQVAMMVNRYTDGVNAYIRGLKNPPVEYKILGAVPEPFENSRVINMTQALTYSLNARGQDYVLSQILQQIPAEKILDLFPEFMPSEYSDYILPGPWAKAKRAAEKPGDFQFVTHLKEFANIPQPAKGNGSNNWVVAPKKSKTGHSILANDTHLGLSLPGIWFETQLVCPKFNVYGASLPDVPGIVVGFTGATAWGPTNGTTDALDYYEVEFTDENSNRYKDGDQELEAQIFRETIRSSRGRSETVDVVWTKWGPVLHREGKYGLVTNWTSYLTGNEILAARKLYESHDVNSCLDSFKTWRVPIQNFVCADQDHIGIAHAGFVPKRAIGEGRFVGRAGSSRYNLHAGIDPKLQLRRVDPKEGYLLSANQRVVDETYPEYLGWDYEEPFRGMRIRRLLEGQEKLSGEDLMRIQTDSYDTLAAMTLPILLKTVKRDQLNESQKEALDRLAKWDYVALSSGTETSLYKSWFSKLRRELYDDEYEVTSHKHFYPHDVRTAWLLKRVSENPEDSDSQWVDNKKTPEKEDLTTVVTKAFQEGWKALEKDFGRDPSRWTWKSVIDTKIAHVAKIPGFGSGQLAMNGVPESVQSNRGWHGPVYKFVIELGPDTRAWMQTPGDTSGDPFSPNFERNVQDWAAGKMRMVKKYKSLEEAKADGATIVEYAPEKMTGGEK